MIPVSINTDLNAIGLQYFAKTQYKIGQYLMIAC